MGCCGSPSHIELVGATTGPQLKTKAQLLQKCWNNTQGEDEKNEGNDQLKKCKQLSAYHK
jgi:hypothetical protein